MSWSLLLQKSVTKHDNRLFAPARRIASLRAVLIYHATSRVNNSFFVMFYPHANLIYFYLFIHFLSKLSTSNYYRVMPVTQHGRLQRLK